MMAAQGGRGDKVALDVERQPPSAPIGNRSRTTATPPQRSWLVRLRHLRAPPVLELRANLAARAVKGWAAVEPENARCSAPTGASATTKAKPLPLVATNLRTILNAISSTPLRAPQRRGDQRVANAAPDAEHEDHDLRATDVAGEGPDCAPNDDAGAAARRRRKSLLSANPQRKQREAIERETCSVRAGTPG
jgi:hypothetical protein